ncbi:hypothetical protein PL921430025 [Planktothrix tepida PCC 9214]|uniref:Uncharacterized protein n=1 Tax=Planktothrix tepida PCC 9214 TaxID=671072 RepID=A0A1J1LI53_9CYAN|nr:hypothetical protein PL921430025 [Planktothrix tepida PCC 9214]
MQAPPAVLIGGRASYFNSLVEPGNQGIRVQNDWVDVIVYNE